MVSDIIAVFTVAQPDVAGTVSRCGSQGYFKTAGSANAPDDGKRWKTAPALW